MILNNRKITPYFKKKKKKLLYTLNQGNSQGSVKGMELSTRVIQDKPVKRFQRQSWGVRFFFFQEFLSEDFLGIMLSTRCLLLL